MEKKTYIAPFTTYIEFAQMQFLAASQLDNTVDNQDVTVTDDEYDGEFGSRKFNWSPASEYSEY